MCNWKEQVLHIHVFVWIWIKSWVAFCFSFDLKVWRALWRARDKSKPWSRVHWGLAQREELSFPRGQQCIPPEDILPCGECLNSGTGGFGRIPWDNFCWGSWAVYVSLVSCPTTLVLSTIPNADSYGSSWDHLLGNTQCLWQLAANTTLSAQKENSSKCHSRAVSIDRSVPETRRCSHPGLFLESAHWDLENLRNALLLFKLLLLPLLPVVTLGVSSVGCVLSHRCRIIFIKEMPLSIVPWVG